MKGLSSRSIQQTSYVKRHKASLGELRLTVETLVGELSFSQKLYRGSSDEGITVVSSGLSLAARHLIRIV